MRQKLSIFLHECQFKWWRLLSGGVLITLIPPFHNINQLDSLWSQRPKRLQSNFNEEHAGRLRHAGEWATVQRNTQITSYFVMGTSQATSFLKCVTFSRSHRQIVLQLMCKIRQRDQLPSPENSFQISVNVKLIRLSKFVMPLALIKNMSS